MLDQKKNINRKMYINKTFKEWQKYIKAKAQRIPKYITIQIQGYKDAEPQTTDIPVIARYLDNSVLLRYRDELIRAKEVNGKWIVSD